MLIKENILQKKIFLYVCIIYSYMVKFLVFNTIHLEEIIPIQKLHLILPCDLHFALA